MREQANRTIRRAFEVLDYLDSQDRPIRLKDVMTDLRYPASSASGVLKSLVVLGYLNYDRDSLSYSLTPRITTLGKRLNEALWQDERILDGMHELGRSTGAAVGLGMQSDIFAQYIIALPGTRPAAYQLRPGAIRPITRSGIGWALLSRRSDAEVERLRRRVNAQEEDRGRHVSAATLAGWLKEVRQRGYALSRNVFREGVGILAMPFAGLVGGRVAAIGVSGDVPWLDENEAEIAADLAKVMQGLA